MWMAGLVYVLQVQGRAKEINGRLGKTVKIQPRFSRGWCFFRNEFVSVLKNIGLWQQLQLPS